MKLFTNLFVVTCCHVNTVDSPRLGLFAGQRQMLIERRDQYKTAAVRAKQAGNEEVAVKYIRTAKVTLQQM